MSNEREDLLAEHAKSLKIVEEISGPYSTRGSFSCPMPYLADTTDDGWRPTPQVTYKLFGGRSYGGGQRFSDGALLGGIAGYAFLDGCDGGDGN